MNVNNEISRLPMKCHLIIELLLFIIVVILLFQRDDPIRVNTQSFAKNNVENISLLKDGTLVETDSNGVVLSTTAPEKISEHGDPLKQLHSISIAIVKTNGENDYHNKIESGFVDKFISSAVAGEHKKPSHQYYQETKWIDGRKSCKRWDITLDWKRVHPCV